MDDSWIQREPSLGGISRTSLPYKNDDDERYTANHYALPLRQANLKTYPSKSIVTLL
jgi:hypothetical protein